MAGGTPTGRQVVKGWCVDCNSSVLAPRQSLQDLLQLFPADEIVRCAGRVRPGLSYPNEETLIYAADEESEDLESGLVEGFLVDWREAEGTRPIAVTLFQNFRQSVLSHVVRLLGMEPQNKAQNVKLLAEQVGFLWWEDRDGAYHKLATIVEATEDEEWPVISNETRVGPGAYALDGVLGKFRTKDLDVALRSLGVQGWSSKDWKADKIGKLCAVADVRDQLGLDSAEMIFRQFREGDLRRVCWQMGSRYGVSDDLARALAAEVGFIHETERVGGVIARLRTRTVGVGVQQ